MSFVYVSAVVFFFFKQKTAYEVRISDWSSDVCSSDLQHVGAQEADHRPGAHQVEEQSAGEGDGADQRHEQQEAARRQAAVGPEFDIEQRRPGRGWGLRFGHGGGGRIHNRKSRPRAAGLPATSLWSFLQAPAGYTPRTHGWAMKKADNAAFFDRLAAAG